MASRFKDYDSLRMLAERLRIARLATHMTQERAANLTRISQSAISLYEQARREPYALATKRMAQAYGVTLDWLFSISDDGGPDILKSLGSSRQPELLRELETLENREDLEDLEVVEVLEDVGELRD